MSTQISISPIVKLEVNTTPITNGTVGRIFFQGTGDVLQQSANLFWDNTNGALELATTADNIFGLRLRSTTGQIKVKPYLNSTYGTLIESRNAADSAYQPLSLSGNKILMLDGNVIINSTSDAGYKLDVNGSFRATDGLFTSSVGGYKLTVQHTGVSQSNTFRVIQLGYSMIDVNTTSVTFMPFPSASGTVGITSWTSTGGQATTFSAKNSEFTPQGGTQAIPLIRFPNAQSPIVMGATATADLRGYLTVSGLFNATSGLGAGQRLLPTLTAIADNDVLVGLDIAPVFTVNTSLVNTATSLRINANYAPGSFSANNNQYGIDISPTFRDSNVSIGLRLNPNFNNITSGGGWALSIENTGYGAIRQTSTATPNIFAGVTSIGANTSGNTGFSLNVSSSIKVGTVNTTGQHLAISHSEGGATLSSIRNQFTSTSAQMLIDVASQGNLRLFGTGNVTINSSTDAGYRLDVNGTARATSLQLTQAVNGLNIGGNTNYSQNSIVIGVNEFSIATNVQNRTVYLSPGNTNILKANFWSGGNIGGVAISDDGSAAVIAGAVLNLVSTTKGFLPPRMTQAQRNAIPSPAIGLEIYQTDATEGKYIYKSSGWTYIG